MVGLISPTSGSVTVFGGPARAELPPGGQAAALARLRVLPGVREVRVHGPRVQVRTSDSDVVARALLDGLGGARLPDDHPRLRLDAAATRRRRRAPEYANRI